MRWRETTLEDLLEFMLDEDLEGQKQARAEFIKTRLGDKWDKLPGKKLPGYETIDAFIEALGEFDPSLKGIYMPWMARLCIEKPNENKTEDLPRVSDDLRDFEKFKRHIPNKDINSYKSFDELYGAIEPFKEKAPAAGDSLIQSPEFKKFSNQISVVVNDQNGWVMVPHTEASSRFLGKNTRWCTAWTNRPSLFDSYNKTDRLFIIYNAQTKKRTQLHLSSNSYMNEQDQPVSMDTLPQWARKPIIDFYKKMNPQLTLKQIMALNKFTDEGENLAVGTDFEGVLDLMKQYGV